MSTKHACVAIGVLGLLSLVCASGCSTVAGPNLGILAFPIPVSPYFQKLPEDKFWEHERYERMPVLGPLTPNTPTAALDEPSDDEVMRGLEKARPVQGGLPMMYETQRQNVRIVKEPISDYIDPPRVYPLVGPAQLHHVHYKCIVHFTETTWVGWPLPYKNTDEDCQEVVYIDHDHLHMVGNVNPGPGTGY
ncbi:MAG: hypothetical protein ABFC77_07275 [Thermoguttaceae bacterium]